MRVFNIEFFTQKFKYVDSVQMEGLEYTFDYMDIAKNKIKISADKKVNKGDYIRAQANDIEICGIVTDIKEKSEYKIIYFKSFMKYLDVDLLIPFDKTMPVEEFLKQIIENEYVNNTDSEENITGLTVKTTSDTEPACGYDFMDGINNMYDIFMYAFEVYEVKVNFRINPAEKSIECSIGKATKETFTIEADLDNLFDRKIVIKETKDSANKIYIYNEEDMTQAITYYKDQDDIVSTEPVSRVLPVIVKSVTIKLGKDESFEERAMAKAMSDLTATKYENLIEIECQEDDMLIRPYSREIGQEANIIKNGIMYNTVLTGYVYSEGMVKLIFGSIRLELTKILKKRWRKQQWQ